MLTTSTGAGGVINVTATNTTAADLATDAALLSFTIATTPDSVVEGPENFTVTLASAAAVVNPTITTSITDDDLRAITLDGPGSVAEGAATGPYTVSLSGVGLGAGQSVTFTLDSASGTATEGTDFSALTVAGLTAAAGIVLSNFTTDPNGTIHVTATNTTAADLATDAALLSFTIATTPDAVVEGPENFTVTLASAAATVVNPPTITTSITDDDLRAIRLDGPGSVAEGAATGPYTVSLSGVGLGAGQSVTFTLDSASGTATEGTDFSALLAGGLTAAAGIVLTTSTGAGGAINVTATNTTAADLATDAALLSFTIATTQDAVVEGPENFTVTLASAAAVVNPTITTSITDDDLQGIRLDGPGSVAEGAATGPYTVSLSGVGLGAGQSVTFTLDSASGTATEGTDFSALLAGGLNRGRGDCVNDQHWRGRRDQRDGDEHHRRRPGDECGAVEFYDRHHAGFCGRGAGKLHGDAGQRGGGGQPNDHDEHYGRRPPGDPAGWSGVGCGRRRDRALHGEPEWCWAWCRPERDVYA